MNNKGQSALEYLMTYGWALVVIVVVIAALFAFGIFNPPSAGTCTGLSKIAYKDHDSNSTMLGIVLMNGAGGEITVSSCTGDTACECTTGTISSGGTFMCTGTYASITGTYSRSIEITYTTKASGLSHTETATCTGNVPAA